MPFRELAVEAENVFSGHLLLRAGDKASISVSGSFSATVVVQRAFTPYAGSPSWHDITGLSYTAAAEADYGPASEDQWVRIGVKSSAFVSGSAICRVGSSAHQDWTPWTTSLAACRGGSAFAANPRLRMTSTVALAGGGAGAFNAAPPAP